jgi:hypothetical protein
MLLPGGVFAAPPGFFLPDRLSSLSGFCFAFFGQPE